MRHRIQRMRFSALTGGWRIAQWKIAWCTGCMGRAVTWLIYSESRMHNSVRQWLPSLRVQLHKVE